MTARNAQNNALADTGNAAASTGRGRLARGRRRWCRSPPSSRYDPGHTPLAVNHQGLFVASTISFNLLPALRSARRRRDRTRDQSRSTCRRPFRGSVAGTAQLFAQSLRHEPMLIAAAIAAVYIVLGILYESYIHPITILSTLPSAGVGAVLALMLFHTEFSIIGADRRDPAHRHRQEERDHDDRFRHRGEARAERSVPTTRSTRPACCASGRS